jgi:hypothetical protein
VDEDTDNRIPPITKVLMNPPFAQDKSKEKEIRFVDHALKQMQDNGLLFSILPRSVMVKQGEYIQWRKDLLAKNSLIAVINFPDDVFYPIGVQTCGIIMKKGIPHRKEQKVLWLRIRTDGLLKSKGKRLPSSRTTNELEDKKELVKKFILGQTTKVPNIPEIQKITPINFSDELLELLPEVYLDNKIPTTNELLSLIDSIVRETLSFMITYNKPIDFSKVKLKKARTTLPTHINFGKFQIESLFDIVSGDFHSTSELDKGDIPLISCGDIGNGLVNFFEIPKENQYLNTLTIAYNALPLTTKFHTYQFGAKDDVAVCINSKNLKLTTLLFIGAILNRQRWRFSYGRKCFKEKIKVQSIYLPIDSKGQIDEDTMEKFVKNTPYWTHLHAYLGRLIV